jgi:hypothetical protein
MWLPSREPEIPLERASHSRGKTHAPVGVARFPQSFDLGWIGIDRRGEIVQRGTVRHGVTRSADHLASMCRDNRAAEEPSTIVMDSHESLFLIIQDGPIDV